MYVTGKIKEESTRKQHLGVVNTILSQGFGVKIKNIGKGNVQKNYFSLCFEVPFIISNVGRVRAGAFSHIKDEQLLVLKAFHSPVLSF